MNCYSNIDDKTTLIWLSALVQKLLKVNNTTHCTSQHCECQDEKCRLLRQLLPSLDVYLDQTEDYLHSLDHLRNSLGKNQAVNLDAPSDIEYTDQTSQHTVMRDHQISLMDSFTDVSNDPTEHLRYPPNIISFNQDTNFNHTTSRIKQNNDTYTKSWSLPAGNEFQNKARQAFQSPFSLNPPVSLISASKLPKQSLDLTGDAITLQPMTALPFGQAQLNLPSQFNWALIGSSYQPVRGYGMKSRNQFNFTQPYYGF